MSAQEQDIPWDAEARIDDERQYLRGPLSVSEFRQKFPNRPVNKSKTLPFSALFINLFNPLNDNKKRPSGPLKDRGRSHAKEKLTPHQTRERVIQDFLHKWRNEVGNDVYPALRLIIPEKDRDRAMYGLKEKAIGKLIVKLLNLHQGSDDGFNLLNWKLPARGPASHSAGDFAGRCYEALSKRPMRQKVGDMRIAEVNELLDNLATSQREEQQLPIFRIFYERMNAEELMWLIRIILRQMKVGATEKTFLNVDGEALFNVSSSLRRVCWELTDPSKRLEGDDAGVSLMSCFQPQLAQYQAHSFQKMVDNMKPTESDPYFWIEEKLDGERIQMHMVLDDTVPGGRRFAWWSRKGKDYTYLYGNSFEDNESALTRHIKDAFQPSLRNIILDGEMITWDPETNLIVAFGTLKTAALSEQRNPYEGKGIRPLFRVFDCLYGNDQDLTMYTLKDRRAFLQASVKNVDFRIEIHKYEVTSEIGTIDARLRKVVEEGAEGLVLKNPRSMYRLNSRNDDWMKVKPEYMEEFGESLDCVIIGGYYGSGHRGGDNPMKCYSFFKVGGGLKAEDYAAIRHETEGKWVKWDRADPPNEYILLGGGDRQHERPDVWIKPCDSVVVEAKAASVGGSEQFATTFTLRFPRFKRLRLDKDWRTALSIQDFIELKTRVERETKEKAFKAESRKKKSNKKLRREPIVAGNTSRIKTPYAGPKTKVFEGLNFCVLTDMVQPQKKSKAELEQIIKSNDGSLVQSPTVKDDVIVIGDKKLVKVASLVKAGLTDIVKGAWILDAIKQSELDGPQRTRFLTPFEPNHMFHMTRESKEIVKGNVDGYGDSYARDVTVDELRRIFDSMMKIKDPTFSPQKFIGQLEEHGRGLGELRASMFRGCVVHVVATDPQKLKGEGEGQLGLEIQEAINKIRFAGGITADLGDNSLTHIIVVDASPARVTSLRKQISESRRILPRIVGMKWVQDCWKEGTLIDEERYSNLSRSAAIQRHNTMLKSRFFGREDLLSDSKDGRPSLERKKNSPTKAQSPINIESVSRPTTSLSSPIPVRRHDQNSQTSDDRGQWRHHGKRHAGRSSHRVQYPHSPDPIPPSLAALLAVTAIPPPSSIRKRGTEPRLVPISVESRSVSDKELSPLDLLLSPPEESDEDEDTPASDNGRESVMSARTLSSDSMPSLDDESIDESPLLLCSPFTPTSRGRKSLPTRSPIKNTLEDHPLSTIDVEELDFRVFLKPQKEEEKSELRVELPPRQSVFKSNLTASLRALRTAARSFSALTSPLVTPDDFLTRSIISIDPKLPFTDERAPPRLEDTPTPALRRYLNPTTNAPAEVHLPSSLAQTMSPTPCTASIQLQTYKISRSGKVTSPSTINRRNSSTSENSFTDIALEPFTRQRNVRENSDFMRVAVMELLMRRRGKLDDQKPGRARWVLPPRKASTTPYAIGENGVPVRWIAVAR
ncbi:hypothetical protein B7494_g1438 [Chlorociboria aeruginascens]|nr:hypothetical protein B7494_g1438 [Chlorociboria aeruginascens]